jgi:hypothetical protein
MAQDGDQLWTLVNTVMKLHVPLVGMPEGKSLGDLNIDERMILKINVNDGVNVIQLAQNRDQ